MIDGEPLGVGVYSINVVKILNETLKGKYKIDLLLVGSKPLKTSGNIYFIPEILTKKQNIISSILRLLYAFFPNGINEEYDVVYCPSHHPLFIGKKRIITIHDILPLYEKNSFSKNPMYYLYYKYLLKLIVKYFDLIVVPSHSTKMDLINKLNIDERKINVIFNGIEEIKPSIIVEDDLSKIDNRLKNNNYIFNLNSIKYPYKNAKNLILAFKEVIKSYKLFLVLAGSKSKYTKELFNLIADNGLKEYIIVLDYLEKNKISTLFKYASMFVYPSCHEGFGFPPLESMQYGCPVIVSNTSSLPEICGSAALYFDPNNIKDIAEKIRCLHDNYNLKSELKSNGYANIQKYTWENFAEKFQILID